MTNSIYTPKKSAVIESWLSLFKYEKTLDLINEYDADATRLANRVAKLCLASIQDELPQWVSSDKNGKLSFNRKPFLHSVPKEPIRPIFLLEINWADSGPGFSWPESYYLTYLPDYNIFVLTASADGPDAYSYEDVAVGYFKASDSVDIESEVSTLLCDWWRNYGSIDHDPWAYLLTEGLIKQPVAEKWRDAVWDSEEAY